MSEEKSVNSEEEVQVEAQNTAKGSLTVPPDDAQASSPTPQVSQKTQGVRPSPDHGAGVLQTAAKKAARSNSRTDIHEYMRLRRNFV
ncbi:MAG: hypothetical protein B6I25_06500 [Planctomycetales bacterium 4572_13]|nr:MAG: hypothetical protein B6I25_06500 [Planctomycetales bacterium 4572_13]